MEKLNENERPRMPKRAVITAGMPYGNKQLHIGHVGGLFVHADTFARFLRDRLGEENVIFVSGTDCYGSPIVVDHKKLVESGDFSGSLEDFVKQNHEKQKATLENYMISLNLFSASGFGAAKEIHREICAYFFNTLYKNGHIKKNTTLQFYDTKKEMFLNGRQVIGRCPIQGCKSTKAYADECELGHQYMPNELIAPKSVMTGDVPEMREAANWYFDLPRFRSLLNEWADKLETTPGYRGFIVKTIREFLKAPVIYVKNEDGEAYEKIAGLGLMPSHFIDKNENKTSFTLIFESFEDRDAAREKLSENGIRYRTGKALVPFRLTGNLEWGVPVPECEGIKNLTFWVWPESLFAPISFTKTYLNSKNKSGNLKNSAEEDWRKWWCSEDCTVYQFIGSDNISFYGPAEVGMWLAMQGKDPVLEPLGDNLSLPYIVANNHLLFLDKKASSSDDIKPPMADDFFNFYTPEQLRAHFLGLGLGIKSVSFQPKPLNPNARPNDGDPALKEGNLLSNVFNRVARSCFYTAQTYFENKLPYGEIDEDIISESQNCILEYERVMMAHEFHLVMNTLDVFIRNMNKYFAANMKIAESKNDMDLREKTLVNTFHMLRTATVLMHPVAPRGTEMILDYLGFDNNFWDWNRIFDTVYDFMSDKKNHRLKTLKPHVDFFEKHQSQIVSNK